MTEAEKFEYSQPSDARVTRNRKLYFQDLASPDTVVLDRILQENRSCVMRSLRQGFIDEFCEEHELDAPSLSTVYRAITSANSRKLRTVVHQKADPEEEYAYLARIESVDTEDLIDIDGSIQHRADFYQRYGWAPRGEEVKRMQIMIDDVSYPIHAAYTTNGFQHWKVFPANTAVTENEVISFVNELEQKLVDSNNTTGVLLLDNASNQRSLAVRTRLESICDGRYYYCAAYSPWLKPIEKGFSLVKKIIRGIELNGEWKNNLIGLINHAFEHYKVGSVHGQVASKHFNIYKSNHQFWTNRMASLNAPANN